MDSRPIVRYAAPVLAIVSGAFALYQLFLAGLSLRMHSYPFGVFYTVMGIAGLAIASALWRTWRGR